VTVKQDAAWFSGANETGPEVSLKENSWEFVTAPPIVSTS
jgi:hypothetical protein